MQCAKIERSEGRGKRGGLLTPTKIIGISRLTRSLGDR